MSAVTGLDNVSGGYEYDAVGNLVSGGGRNVTYSSFRKPILLSDANSEVELVYGPHRSRIYQKSTSNDGQTETWYYFRGQYEEVQQGGRITQKHYITQNSETIAVYEDEVAVSDPGTILSSEIQYFHKDHLGSVHAVTDESGNLLSISNHDAFGQQRILVSGGADGSGSLGSSNGSDPVYSSISSFTGHEQLSVNLIHMNGRVYDPSLGRFLSADPLIPNRYDGQSLNRYSYVRNNPLGYVDRNGFSGEHVLQVLEYFKYREFQFFTRSRISFPDFRQANIFIHEDVPNRRIRLGAKGRGEGGGHVLEFSSIEHAAVQASYRHQGYEIYARNGISADDLNRVLATNEETGIEYTPFTITEEAYSYYHQYQQYLDAKKKARRFRVATIVIRVAVAYVTFGLSETSGISNWFTLALIQATVQGATTYVITGDNNAAWRAFGTTFAFAAAGHYVNQNFNTSYNAAGEPIGELTGTGVLVKIGLHGTIGGLSTELSGGDFLSGFLSSGLTAYLSGVGALAELIPGSDPTDILARALIAGFTGGVISEITGGDFESGFANGAIAHLVNQEATNALRNGAGPPKEATTASEKSLGDQATGHHYSLTTRICHTSITGCGMSLVPVIEVHGVPFTNDHHTGPMTLLGGNEIIHTHNFDVYPNTSTNTATDHIFPGTVTHTFYIDNEAWLTVHTVGVGPPTTWYRDLFNEMVGLIGFQFVHDQMVVSAYLELNMPDEMQFAFPVN